MNRSLLLYLLFSAFLALQCRDASSEAGEFPADYGYEIVRSFPHDRAAFTQGLVFAREAGREFFYEGTGLRGRSELRRVNARTGQVLQRRRLSQRFFGEGVALVGQRIYQLTWQSKLGFIYDRENFELLTDFSYPTEGWGLTYDPVGERLILSDGTARLYFLDPESLAIESRVDVRDSGRPVPKLNELEWVDGLVYANVWQTEKIVMIDPQDGRVVGRIHLKGLLRAAGISPRDTDVLNGIAYDAEEKRLFVTGKLWPKVFEIRPRKIAR